MKFSSCYCKYWIDGFYDIVCVRKACGLIMAIIDALFYIWNSKGKILASVFFKDPRFSTMIQVLFSCSNLNCHHVFYLKLTCCFCSFFFFKEKFSWLFLPLLLLCGILFLENVYWFLVNLLWNQIKQIVSQIAHWQFVGILEALFLLWGWNCSYLAFRIFDAANYAFISFIKSKIYLCKLNCWQEHF